MIGPGRYRLKPSNLAGTFKLNSYFYGVWYAKIPPTPLMPWGSGRQSVVRKAGTEGTSQYLVVRGWAGGMSQRLCSYDVRETGASEKLTGENY